VSGAPVEWADVRTLNELGFTVLSRVVVLDPPPDDQVPQGDYDDGAAVTAAILALIATMAVLEVTLLAGPAFAVGARRQRRSLALLAATGGEPAHVRRVVLSQGLLVGSSPRPSACRSGIGVAAVVRAVVTLGAELGTVRGLAARRPARRRCWARDRPAGRAGPGVGDGPPADRRRPAGTRVTSAGAGRPALVGLLLMGVGPGRHAGGAALPVRLRRLHRAGRRGRVPSRPSSARCCWPRPPWRWPAASAARLPLALRFATRDADRSAVAPLRPSPRSPRPWPASSRSGSPPAVTPSSSG
jgi:hypothetical protein